MGIGLSAHGVNMNRLPGYFTYPIFIIVHYLYNIWISRLKSNYRAMLRLLQFELNSNPFLQDGTSFRGVTTATTAIRFARRVRENRTDRRSPPTTWLAAAWTSSTIPASTRRTAFHSASRSKTFPYVTPVGPQTPSRYYMCIW